MHSDLKKLLNLENLIPLLENHKVKNAYVFGSILTEHFDSNSSDFDFLVEIEESDPLVKGELLISLWDKLESLTDRKVDLLTPESLKNPILLKSINSNKLKIYDRSGAKVFN
ncbi:nucleotidyltransferase family protein [Algoriphagus sp.]|uniref:nucleotidyltransferase family protein n=1 Tax=Algoriphagus sp. TaxID=1872435 RepID=UPI00391D8DED